MSDSQGCGLTVAAFLLDYERYLTDVGGLALNSPKLHLKVSRRLLGAAFGADEIRWSELRFSQVAEFLSKEFRRLPNHWTQRAWLMAVRKLLRYLGSEGRIPIGWEDALPKRVNRKQASLPRYLSVDERQALWNACQQKNPRQLRDRALLLVYMRLGLRTEEVAQLRLKDIDWEHGHLRIRSTKTKRERVLPLAHDIGEALIEHLRARFPKSSRWMFAPRHPPYTEERIHSHVKNTMCDLFRRAGLKHRRIHSLRHGLATEMINGGATIKEIADVLGHKCLASTLIYAKLNMKALAQVCLPWPGGVE